LPIAAPRLAGRASLTAFVLDGRLFVGVLFAVRPEWNILRARAIALTWVSVSADWPWPMPGRLLRQPGLCQQAVVDGGDEPQHGHQDDQPALIFVPNGLLRAMTGGWLSGSGCRSQITGREESWHGFAQ
jgi:hypothetical protein